MSYIDYAQIGRALGRIEHQYLCAKTSEDERAIKGIVQHLIEQLILPSLRAAGVPIVEVNHAGSQCEYTALPGSDFDLQFAINMTNVYPKPTLVNPGTRAHNWMAVKGGPAQLLNASGLLSNQKVRDAILSKLDSSIGSYNNAKRCWSGKVINVRRRVGYGPAVTLIVDWKTESFEVDVVATVREEDLSNVSSNQHLFARRITVSEKYIPHGFEDAFWKVSNGPKQADLMSKFNDSERGRNLLKLLKTVKVIKKHQPQLAFLTTAILKTIVFYMNDRYPQQNQWRDQRELAARFANMIDMIQQHTSSGSLKDYFDKEKDLLQWQSSQKPQALTTLANYLQHIRNKGGYMELLQCVPGI